MQIYRVGGSVRDELLGLPVHDRDWVVIGATPAAMLAAGYRAVGKDFPVFLHPDSQEEYALARTERKTGPGYKGFAVSFSPDVTLEEDLARRDLTVNAMAIGPDGALIDPYGGHRDLAAGVLRHVTDAFAEDPLRILRVARFSARFADFHIAPETQALMRQIVAAGEADALVAERVWRELSRGLMERRPSRMLAVLDDSGALAVLVPAWTRLPAPVRADTAAALDRAADRDAELPVRFAIWLAPLDPEAARRTAEAMRAPIEPREVALRLAEEVTRMPSHEPITVAARAWLDHWREAAPAELLACIGRLDAIRRPARLEALVQAQSVRADQDSHCAGGERLRAALQAVRAIDQGAIAARHAGEPLAIRAAIDQARLDAIAALKPAD